MLSLAKREARRFRRRETKRKRRAKTVAFYQQIAPSAVQDPRYPWPLLALEQYRRHA